MGALKSFAMGVSECIGLGGYIPMDPHEPDYDRFQNAYRTAAENYARSLAQLRCQDCYGMGENIDGESCPACDGLGYILPKRQEENNAYGLQNHGRSPAAGPDEGLAGTPG